MISRLYCKPGQPKIQWYYRLYTAPFGGRGDKGRNLDRLIAQTGLHREKEGLKEYGLL